MFNEDDDFEEERRKERERIYSLPIFLKAGEILELINSIIATIEDDETNEANAILLSMKDHLYQDAVIIQPKIAGAEGGGLYEIKMANAAIIREAGISLSTQCSGMELFGYQYEEYVTLLRYEIEEFRQLFLEWIDTFDPSHRGIDRWGLFNPPGVNPN